MTGITNFDPDRFVSSEPETAKVVPLHKMPAAWEHGLSILADRGVPQGAAPDRWAQIVEDAGQIASRYLLPVVAAGWSMENLFGFDPDEPSGELSLAVVMRGRLLVHIDKDEAWLKSPGGAEFHRPRMRAGAPFLWNFSHGKAGK